jgi:hypothetical protein
MMRRIPFFAVLVTLAAMAAAQDPFETLFAQSSPGGKLEVLSPWAEVDPIPLRGISPRIDSLAGKKIGVFVNYKRAARPIGLSLEKRLKTMFPDSEVRFFYSTEWNVLETETKNRDKFGAWAREANAAILLVGD